MPKADCRTTLLQDIPVALVLLTRLPLPRLPDRAFDSQSRAGWAFPLAGVAVALPACAIAGLALAAGVGAGAAAGLLLGTQILVTGALHEDGLADTADGLWGGFTRTRRLEIMKDSHIGTYGVLALILSLGLRWIALSGLLAAGAFGAVIASAALSRAFLPVLMTALPPARTAGLSHSVGVPGYLVSGLALVLGLAIALLGAGPAVLIPALVAVVAIAGFACLARVKIGGQTGDILGAAQQIGEISLLLGLSIALASQAASLT